jgi:hypothetical protein
VREITGASDRRCRRATRRVSALILCRREKGICIILDTYTRFLRSAQWRVFGSFATSAESSLIRLGPLITEWKANRVDGNVVGRGGMKSWRFLTRGEVLMNQPGWALD